MTANKSHCSTAGNGRPRLLGQVRVVFGVGPYLLFYARFVTAPIYLTACEIAVLGDAFAGGELAVGIDKTR